mmetsp:Transcript_34554/g.111556  ORF Transcript_34554/g.111556 Transcript_34554/m.111556 type:complete len:114 (-) Transcript_34554:565-906(-)
MFADALAKYLNKEAAMKLQRREAKVALLGAATCLVGLVGYTLYSRGEVLVKAEGEKPKRGSPRGPETGSSLQLLVSNPPTAHNLRRTLTQDEIEKHEAMEDKVWDVMFWSVME